MQPIDPDSDRQQFGRFHILAVLGEGGFGVVYLAHDVSRPDDLAAVKVPHRIHDSPGRWTAEIAALRKVGGEHFPALVDVGIQADPPWFAVEYVRGLAVLSLVRWHGTFPEPAIWRVGYNIASGLRQLEETGLVHRDVSPGNVMVNRTAAVILDFGLARLTEWPDDPREDATAVATFNYAPPEQVLYPLSEASTAGTAADVFMLGAVLLFMATGHGPRDGRDYNEVARQAREEDADLSGLASGPLYDLISSCLLRSPSMRPALSLLMNECKKRMTPTGSLADLLPGDVVAELDATDRQVEELVASCRTCERDRSKADGRSSPLLRDLASRLSDLRGRAGLTDEQLAQKTSYSIGVLQAAESGRHLPSLQVTMAYVEACGGDPQSWRTYWTDIRNIIDPYRTIDARKADNKDGGPVRPRGHVFISYVHEDSAKVEMLRRSLEDSGVRVWLDTADLLPGQDWEEEIRRAIIDDALIFIACFSSASVARRRTYQREELLLAVEELRLRRLDDVWFIPVRFDDCIIPLLEIGAGRTLAALHRADLFGTQVETGLATLVAMPLSLS